MLLHFGVKNFLSMCDRQELALVASSLKDRSDCLLDCPASPSGAVVPATVIYGANGSGKTNMLSAVKMMREMVLWSQTRGEPGGGVPRSAYKLDPACSEEPSEFTMDFVVDEVRYHFGFEANDEAFLHEWLYAFPRSHRRKLYERRGTSFDFGRSLRGQNSDIAKLTRPNSLFLSAAAQNGHKQLSGLYEYFQSMAFVWSGGVGSAEISQGVFRDGLEKRVVRFLELIDTGVAGCQKKERVEPEDILEMRKEFARVLAKFSGGIEQDTFGSDDRQVFLELGHRGKEGTVVYFDLELESAGTRRLLHLLGYVFEALDRGVPLWIDELDASLHPRAAEAVLELFCSSRANGNGGQLIATLHDTNLLKSELLRRDQIWFVEKSSEGSTEIYPLSDFRTRKGDNLELGYLQGRYGAVPRNDPLSVTEEVS